jgi:glycosyltransferase involved in cell wall biosynthesis
MGVNVSPLVVFLCYTQGQGLRYHLADWLSALTDKACGEFEIVGLSEPREEEEGLFQRLRTRGTASLHLQLVKSLSDPASVDTLSRATIVHCHGFRQLAELHRLRQIINASYRCVLSIHYFRNGTLWRVPFTNYISGTLLNKAADMVHFLSTRSKSEFTGANFLFKRTLPYHIFPLGCDETEFTKDNSSDQPKGWEFHKQLTEGRPNIVYLANFSRNKQHLWLIDAISAVLLARNARLWLLGDGPELPGVREYVKKRSLSDHVILPGFVQRRFIPWILSCMHVAVCASLSENSPHSIMEPMFSGVPVVTFNVGTASQLISDFSRGFVLEKPRVKEEFSRKVDLILCDPNLQKRMAQESKKFVMQYYTWRVCAENSLAMYRALLQS